MYFGFFPLLLLLAQSMETGKRNLMANALIHSPYLFNFFFFSFKFWGPIVVQKILILLVPSIHTCVHFINDTTCVIQFV